MLRTRLFLNLIPFAAIVLAVGTYAIVLFSRLAGEVDLTVTENQRCAIAAQHMRAALSAMRTSLYLAMEGEDISAAPAFAEHGRVFEANFSVQTNSAHLFSGTPLIEQLRTNYQGFHAAGLTLLELKRRRDQQQVFNGDVAHREMALQVLLDQIGQITRKNILATSQNLREINRRVTRLMILAIAIALLISAVASFRLGQSVLRPIHSLTRAAREIGRGKLESVVPSDARDELGELADAFNKMAAQLRVYRASTAEQIVRLHRTMEAALAAFPDPVFVLDRRGRIELRNRAAQELGVQLGLNDTLPGRLADTAAEVIRSGVDVLPHSFKDALCLPVGAGERSYLPRILVMRGERQEPVGVAVVLHDVTRFRLLDDAKTNLVATVSHELKTPLTSVRMVLHLLLEKTLGGLTARQDELLRVARKDAERLLQILNDLLDLTRLEAGQSGLKLERVSPAALLGEVVDEVRQEVLDQGLTLSSTTEPELPPVLVDRQRLGHVFHNLIANAVKHSPPGGEIRLCAARGDDGQVQFCVADQGPGVPEAYQARIFDRFFRVPGQTKTGAGLGLSIAREIVVAHGGHIGVRSQPGKGSEFYLTLTVADQAPAV